MLRIIAIAILIFVAVRIILRIIGLGASRKKQPHSRKSGSQTREKHRKGDVIIEYEKPPKKKPRLEADDVDFEEIE